MASISEALEEQSQLNASLNAGLDAISSSQFVTFTKYVRVVLPADGFVFWVKASLLSESALLNALRFNSVPFTQTPTLTQTDNTRVIGGSIHYSTQTQQAEDEVTQRNQVIFTSKEDLDPFNETGPSVRWLGEFDGIRFFFSRRNPMYLQAGIYHYVGDAVMQAFESQIIDDPAQINTRDVIVSNSLPLWIKMDTIMPLYPSFLALENAHPPYATIHIDPQNTTALQAFPHTDSTGSQWQLTSDKVRITIYGLRNGPIMDFVQYVIEQSLNDEFGIMNMPIVKDGKRGQTELVALAQQKIVEFEVSYYQSRMRDIARRLILSAIPTVYTQEL